MTTNLKSMAMLLVAGVIAGCGGDASAPSGGGFGFGSGGGGHGTACSRSVGTKGDTACYTMVLKVTGDVTVDASSTVGSVQFGRGNCQGFLAKFAASNGGEVQLPSVALSNQTVAFSANLEGWRGPGTYELSSQPHTAALSLGGSGGLTANGVHYSAPVQGAKQAATASAVAQADGSLSITFTNLADNNDPSRTISGTGQWSCVNV